MQTIVITGMDGAGKTTLIRSLFKRLTPLKIATIHLPDATFTKATLMISGQGTPLGDPWTDRLIFALDNRLAAYKIKALMATDVYDLLLMQRGWMDSYIHGATQGFKYDEITQLLRPDDLPRANCSIYLDCDPAVAYDRIKNDHGADKFETPSFMQAQHRETKRFYEELKSNQAINTLFDEPRLYINTTDLTPEEVEVKVVSFLKKRNMVGL